MGQKNKIEFTLKAIGAGGKMQSMTTLQLIYQITILVLTALWGSEFCH